VTLSVRALTSAEAESSGRLGWEAFGVPSGNGQPSAPPLPGPGMRPWGVFEQGQLVAKAVDREYDSWFGGAAVPTCGVSGVTVAAEHRGRGMLRPLLTTLLDGARKRGAAISTLFPTAPQIYRGLGFETVGQFDTVELPTAALAAVRVPGALTTGTLTTRRAATEDFDAIRQVYDAWAAAQNGPLTRRGPSFPATGEDFVAAFTGVTLAVDEQGRVQGYASWRRGQGSGEHSRIRLADLVATQADATRVLARTIGSFASVAPATLLDTSGDDLLRSALPTSDWKVTRSEPYMLRLLDPDRAIGLRHFPAHLAVDLTFALADELLTDLDGSWRLTVRDGRASCVRSHEPPTLRLTGRGLALSYAGTQSAANLRMAGLLDGDDRDDERWDSVFGGRQVHIRDYF